MALGPAMRMHKIPSPRSEPYICIGGPDGGLWFCESGASKIGRFDAKDFTFREFDIPVADAMPMGSSSRISTPSATERPTKAAAIATILGQRKGSPRSRARSATGSG